MAEETSQTEKKHYKGEAEGTAGEKAAVGGEKGLQISNVLFQSDADALAVANALLARLKTRKDYFEISVELCPVPVEPGDTVGAEEFVTSAKSLSHTGLIRQIRLSVTPASQTLILTLED